MSDYWNKKYDELKKEEEKKKKKNSNSSSDYWQNKMNELEADKSSSPTVDIAPVKDTKEEDKKKWYEGWFQKGAFEDGYDFGDVTKTILGTGQDVSENVLAGIVGMGEKAVDAGAYVAGGVGKMFGADGFADRTKDFIANDLYDEKAVAKAITRGTLANLVADTEEDSIFAEKSDSVLQSGGQLLGTAALQAVGVPWFLTTGVTAFGGEVEQAFNDDATYLQAGGSALISAGAEVLTEMLSGGIKFGGKTLDDVLLQPLVNKISNKVGRTLVNLGIDAVGEGAEEVVSSVFSNLGTALYKEESIDELLLSEEAMDEYLESFIGGLTLGGGMGGVNAVNSIKTGRDYKTGLTENEQKVIDKEIENRIAEEEADGKKLTNKEKTAIEEAVKHDLEKGYISIDTIESALGGETYDSYKSMTEHEAAVKEEIEALENLPKEQITVKQSEQLAALRDELKGLNSNSTIAQYKSKLSSEVSELAKADRLGEAYNERARSGQKFTADLSKYNAKQKAIVQKAIDSGILNNTNRTHEFVDMVAKISADKGVSFDFANNAKLKETGFAVDGATINGFVNKDGVTVNIDSKKAVNSVVGHEITHVLEGTELYGELQKAVTEYAKAKGDYQGRYDAIAKLYKSVEDADIDAELTADLVGDYLFTDSDFINNLSTKHRNVFEKIYDEIKYLYKVATAGSKEARQLEKVKKAFEDAYRADNKGVSGTKYSVSDKNIKDVSTGYASGETYFTMTYTKDGETVGYLEYGEYDGQPNVKMIEVEPEYRRQGIATKLMQELQKKYPDAEIDFGMSTPDGTKFLDAVTYDVTDDAVVADRQKLKDLQTELNELQEKLDVLYDTETLTEAQEAEMHKLGDRWTEVYDTIRELEKNLRGKRATKTFVKTDSGVKYSLTEDTDNAYLDAANRGDTETAQKMVDKVAHENGYTVKAYHGTSRADRVGNVFRPDRATSGPMAFFTDNKDIADNYARDKKDTSLAYDTEYDSYYTQFRVNRNGKNISIPELWNHLSFSEKNAIKEKAKHIKFDDDYENIIVDTSAEHGNGAWDSYTLNMHRGNALEALVDTWLETGDLLDREADFMKVLDLVGIKGVEYRNPDARYEKTYDTWLKIQKPFDTDNANQSFYDSLSEWIENHDMSVYERETSNADFWDKNNQTPESWLEKLSHDIENGTTHAWTVIPDFVTDYLKEQGYDGIKDKGGKGGGAGHTVWIPFSSEQVKSADPITYDDNGNVIPLSKRFDSENKDIRYSLSEEGESPRTYGNYNIFGEDIAYKPEQTAAPVQDSVQDVAPVREGVTTEESTAVGYETEPTVSEMVQVAPIKAATPTENIAPLTQKNRKPSKAALARLTKKQTYSGGANLQGAYNADGKQYMSDGVFAVEFNTVDESIPHNKDFPIDKMQSLLSNAVENQSAEKYGIDLEKIIEINKANKGNKDSKALVNVGGNLYDGKYIEALMRAVPNPTFALSDFRAGAKMLVAVGENGTAILMPVRAGDKLTAAYEAQEIKTVPENYADDFAPMTEADAMERDAMQGDRLASLTDEDAPIETRYEATPPLGEMGDYRFYNTLSSDPLKDRDIKSVGNRKVKAYMYENPEVKPFFQREAQIMLRELADTTRGERLYNDELYYESGGQEGWTGVERNTSDEIAYLLDECHYTYAEIEKGLKAIIEDNGAENNACSKRIEFMLNDRLRLGYTDFTSGIDIPPNGDYINLLNERQITEYNEESFKRYLEAQGDNAVPVEIDNNVAPLPKAENVAPVAPVAEKYEAIRPERPKRTLQEAPEPQPRMVRADKSDKGEMRSWAETSTESEALNGEIDIEELDQDLIHYQPISNRKTLEKANTRLGQLGYEQSVNYFEGRFAGADTKLEDIVLGERLVQEAVKRGDKATAMKLIQDISILGTELGQKVQALSIIQRLTPEGQLAMLNRIVERGKAKGDKAFEGVELTQEMGDRILGTRKADGTFDQNELNAVMEDVKQEIADQMKVTAGEKINAWRYLAMLGNPKTHGRNMISNVAMYGTAAVKNAMARTAEDMFLPKAQSNANDIAPVRTKTWKKSTEYVKAYAKQVTAEMEGVLSSDSKYSQSGDIKAKRRIYKNKALNYLYELNNKWLTKEDTIFKNLAFESSFREYLTANGIKTKADIQNNPEIVEKGKQYATEQALIATFQQESWLANKISEIENKNAAFGVAVGAVMPFKKTPINIAKTGLMYSPLGFAKSAYDAVQVKKGNMDASTLIDHLAQNVTGTALTIAGYLLAQAGVLNGAGDDDKEGSYDYQLGEQGYSLKIGDQTYSLSWLTPVSMPLFVGANAYEQLVEDKGWSGDVVMETLAQTLDPLSEMSFLSGLDNVLSSYDSGIEKFMGIGTSMMQNYATQFVPTLSSQVAAITDDTKRTTKVGADSDFRIVDETVNQLKYKIPGLRQTLEPVTDIWGNEVKQSDNLLTRAFESAIAPYSRKENIATEIDEEIKSLYRETGEDGLIPTVPKNYLNYNGEKFKMSAKEHTAYKQTYGQTANAMLEALFNTSTYRNATAEERADMVDDVYDYARDEANRQYFTRYGVEYTNASEEGKEYYRENFIKGAIENDVTVEEYGFSYKNPEKYAFLKQIGVSYDEYAASEDSKDAYSWAFNNPDKYAVAKAVANDVIKYRKYASELYDIKADKDSSGKSINGSRKEKVLDYINNLDADYGEKIILFKMEYNADDTYNYDIIEYLNNREDITYDEMVSILKELGFIVHSDGRVTW